MKISIIMPVYNCEKYLHTSLESILKQTYKNWELILVDDGSKDNSYNLCCDYALKDSRIKVLQQLNSGSGPARNNGIRHISGEYVLFCDADDFCEIDALEQFSNAANEFNADLIASNYHEFKYDSDGNIQLCGKKYIIEKKIYSKKEARKAYYDLCRMSLINAPWAKLYKASIIRENGIEFENIRRCQDIVFNLSYYSYVNSVSIINKVTYNYLTPDGSIYLSKFPKDMFDILKQVNQLQISKLEEWGEYTSKVKTYFDTMLLRNIAICMRLNYQNKWKFSKEEQRGYYIMILNDRKTVDVTRSPVYGGFNKILKLIIKSKSVLLVKCLSLAVLIKQQVLNGT